MTKKALFDLFVNDFDVLYNSEVTKENLELLFGENVDVYDLGKEDNRPCHYQTDIEKGQALMRSLYQASCQYRELIDKYNGIVELIDEYNGMLPDYEKRLDYPGDEPGHWADIRWTRAVAYFNAIPDDEEFCRETLNKYSLTKKDIRRLLGSRCDFNNLLDHRNISHYTMRLLFGHADVNDFEFYNNEPDHYSTTLEKGQAFMRGLFVKKKHYDVYLKEWTDILDKLRKNPDISETSIKAIEGEIKQFDTTGLEDALDCFDCIPDDVPSTEEYIK